MPRKTTKHVDGISITKTKSGYRWQCWSKGHVLAHSGTDGYHHKRDMLKAITSLRDKLNIFIFGELHESAS